MNSTFSYGQDLQEYLNANISPQGLSLITKTTDGATHALSGDRWEHWPTTYPPGAVWVPPGAWVPHSVVRKEQRPCPMPAIASFPFPLASLSGDEFLLRRADV